MSWVLNLARPEVLSMRAYESARSLVSSGENLLYLDANESPESPSGLNRYPEPQPRELVQRLSEIYLTPVESLVVGRGSDEAIDLLARVFCRSEKDAVLICPPTYGMYSIAAQIQGARTLSVPLLAREEGFALDEKGLEAALAQGVKLVFLCSPNNPTGTAFDPASLERICRFAEGKALVVIDEAYAEFSDKPSMLGRLPALSSLVVLRTLSKAWGMAGARCGIAAASPEVIRLLHKVRAPYPLSTPMIRSVMSVIGPEDEAAMRERVKGLRAERDRMMERFRGLPRVEKVFASSANFFIVRFSDSSAAMKAARDAGIILRDRGSEPGLQRCVRITVGGPAENQALLRALGGRA